MHAVVAQALRAIRRGSAAWMTGLDVAVRLGRLRPPPRPGVRHVAQLKQLLAIAPQQALGRGLLSRTQTLSPRLPALPPRSLRVSREPIRAGMLGRTHKLSQNMGSSAAMPGSLSVMYGTGERPERGGRDHAPNSIARGVERHGRRAPVQRPDQRVQPFFCYTKTMVCDLATAFETWSRAHCEQIHKRGGKRVR
jgi:hypothetical protein